MKNPLSYLGNAVVTTMALGSHGRAESGEVDTATVQANRTVVLKELGDRKLGIGPHRDTAIVLVGKDGFRMPMPASVVVTADRRIVMLIKARIQPKGTYDGCLFSDQPIPAADIDNDAYDRKQ